MNKILARYTIVLASALMACAGAVRAADVTVGYQLVYGPWKTQMERIKKEGLGGKSVEFVKFTSGTEVINAMASGSVSSPFTAFWISSFTLPASGSRVPATSFSSVVLPAPLRPSTHQRSVRRIFRLKSS